MCKRRKCCGKSLRLSGVRDSGSGCTGVKEVLSKYEEPSVTEKYITRMQHYPFILKKPLIIFEGSGHLPQFEATGRCNTILRSFAKDI